MFTKDTRACQAAQETGRRRRKERPQQKTPTPPCRLPALRSFLEAESYSLLPTGRPCLSALSRYGSAVPTPQCKASSRRRFLVGNTGGLVGYTTWACNVLSLGWTDYHPRGRPNWPTGGTLADLQGACTVGPAVSTQRATLTRPTSPGGGAVCMYLHTQYAFLPSCRATSLMQSTLARVRF